MAHHLDQELMESRQALVGLHACRRYQTAMNVSCQNEGWAIQQHQAVHLVQLHAHLQALQALVPPGRDLDSHLQSKGLQMVDDCGCQA